MQFREANANDLPAICILGDDVNAMHHRVEPHVFAPGGNPQFHRDHWLTTVGKEQATTFLAIDQAQVIGFITVSAASETHSLFQPVRFGRVGTVGVSETYRSRGVGRQLMALAEAWAAARGCEEIRLTVGAFNERAESLYAELGYEIRSKLLVRALKRSSEA
jgi:ribosomal protein S18 acetylase RimI-like enzyme